MSTCSQSARGGPRCPLLLAALAYAAGILLAQYCWRPRLWWLAAAATCMVGAGAFALRSGTRWRAWAAQGCVLACAIALGALAYDVQWAREPDRSGWESLTDGSNLVISGHVVRDGLLRGSGSSLRQSVDLQLETAAFADGDRAPHVMPNPVIASSADRRDTGTEARGLFGNHGKKRRRSEDPCKVNAAWPAELLAASGLARCLQPQTKPKSRQEPATQDAAHGPEQVTARAQIAESPAQDDEAGEGDEASANTVPGRSVPTPQGIVRISIYSRPADHFEDAQAQNSSALPDVFTYGQRLRFPIKLRAPRNFGNPGSLDYVGYLHEQGIYALGSVRADRIHVLDGIGGSRWGLLRSRVRRSVLGRVHALWPARQAGLLDAMLIGERSFIGRETSTAFQRTGIYHILVVSGMNVGILAFVVFWMLRRFRCGEVLATLVTIVLSCGYAYIAEAGAPIVRSVVMLAVYLCTRLLYRDRALLNALGAAALVLMVADPRNVTDASFQLTFLSVLAISGIALPLIERTSQPYRTALRWLDSTDYDMSLEPRMAQFRIELRMLAARLAPLVPRLPKRWTGVAVRVWRRRVAQSVICKSLGLVASACELLVVSLTTQVALALPMAWYFHRAPVAGLAANLIAVPLTGVLMPASVAAVLLSYLWMPLARVPAWVTSFAVNGITYTVNMLGGIRAADLRIATPAAPAVVAAVTAFAMAVLLSRKRPTLAIAGVTALCATAVWMTVLHPTPKIENGKLEITAIDVGQAESFLVVTPEGRMLLVDAAGSLGPWQSEFDFGEDVIAPYLWSRGISRLDAVAVTHAHSDHYGGMASIVKIFRPAEMWIGPNAPDRGFDTLVQGAREAGVHIVRHSGGEAFAFGGTQVRVLAPARTWRPALKPKNDDSLVFWLGYGSTSALLEADAGKASEREMLGIPIRSDLLKVAHNGSNTSTTPEFLASVQPTYALISVGARNLFGHPRPEVLERLAAMHVRTYRTDLLGAVTFLLDGKQVTAKLPMMKSR